MDIKVDTVWFEDFKKELPNNVDGKVFVITGTTSGTGYVAARTAAELGGEVVLLNRPSERATKALETLKKDVPNGIFVPMDCDLQSFENTRAAAQALQTKYDSKGIYCVCWNAGIMATPDQATKDGYDTQMQTNHLSHFLLTALLYPLLETCASQTGADPRIVNHSSGARHMTPNKGLERKYLEKNGGNLGGNSSGSIQNFGGPEIVRYAHTKLANAVFTKALHEKLQAKQSKVRAICADPGMSTTSLGNHLGDIDFSAMADRMQSSEDGAMGILTGMLHPAAQSGVHYGPATTKGPAVPNAERPYEVDPAGMQILWEASEVSTGVKFVI